MRYIIAFQYHYVIAHSTLHPGLSASTQTVNKNNQEEHVQITEKEDSITAQISKENKSDRLY